MFRLKKKIIIILVLSCTAAGILFNYEFFQKIYHKNFVSEQYQINFQKVLKQKNSVPFLVLGSGPASLAAALYGARAKVYTVVLKGNQPGGALTGTSYIENWPAIRKIRGAEVVQDFEDQAAQFGAVMVSDVAQSVDLSQWPFKVTTEEGLDLYALSLFIGTGATPRRLNVPGETQYWGKGVTTCAICDAPYHKGHEVVVVGGGDSAVEEALELSPYVKTVFILVRTDKMRASPTMIEKIESCSNVQVVYNSTVSEIHGDGAHVTSVDVQDMVTKEIKNWSQRKGVFLAIGHSPNTSLFDTKKLKVDEIGYVQLQGRTQETSIPGVFCAGDVSDRRYRQAGVAAGDGIKAGLDAVWWLMEHGYNKNFAEQLEPYMFDKKASKHVSIAQVNSLKEYDEFKKQVKHDLVMLDFYSPYCPACMHMLPAVEWVAAKFSDRVTVAKVDTSLAFDLVKKFGVPQIPYLIMLKDGQKVDFSDQELDRAALCAFIKKQL